MPVLGSGGRLIFKRPAPDPIIYASHELLDGASNQLLDTEEGYLSGDRVQGVGLPVYVDGWPIKPMGWAMYGGSRWYLGPNRSHCTNDTAEFYKGGGMDFPDGAFGDDAGFYAQAGDEIPGGGIIPEDPEDDYFIHVNALGYMSFYRTRCAALRGCIEDRVDLAPVGGPIVIGPYGTATYNNAVAECLPAWGDYSFSDFADESTGMSICQNAPDFEAPYAGEDDYENADIQQRSATKGYIWEVVCGVREWSLNMDAPSVDTTGVSEKFGEAVKSVVNGGGSLEFFIDRECHPEGKTNGIPILELLLMTNQGSQASAEFWILTGSDCDTPPNCAGRIDGSLFYEADVLITNTSINVRPTEMVVGAANFVTTGEVRLLQEPYRERGAASCGEGSLDY